jgi:hypothetical protein
MPYRIWIAAVSLLVLAFGRASAAEVDAIAPGAPGVLTKCRDWLVTSSCRKYHHVDLPPRIAVGDTVTIAFGSSPKEYGFSVARIELKGHHCAIFSEATGNRRRMDKIDVVPCYRAGEGSEGSPLQPPVR